MCMETMCVGQVFMVYGEIYVPLQHHLSWYRTLLASTSLYFKSSVKFFCKVCNVCEDGMKSIGVCK